MKTLLYPALALLLCTVCPASTDPSANSAKITGDYVEARTASVFAGACHYNGELVTTGRDAVMAWSFTSGSYKGTDLAGVRAMASVTSDASLGQDGAARKAELVVDSHATAAQASAVAGLVREKCAATLGKIVAVRRAPIAFTHVGREYTANADGFASLAVQSMPNDECCAQPNLVWYSPLTSLQNHKVGYTQTASYTAGTLADRWERQGENSAFYGTFAY